MEIVIVRSPARRKTVSATVRNGRLEIRLPAHLSASEEAKWVTKLTERYTRKINQRNAHSDAALHRCAQALNEQYFQGRLHFAIRWVSNMAHRWGSCTPATGQIRISQQLANMPRFVLKYVIMHELAHLVYPDHSERFKRLVNLFEYSERAIGFLTGWTMALHRGESDTESRGPSDTESSGESCAESDGESGGPSDTESGAEANTAGYILDDPSDEPTTPSCDDLPF